MRRSGTDADATLMRALVQVCSCRLINLELNPLGHATRVRQIGPDPMTWPAEFFDIGVDTQLRSLYRDGVSSDVAVSYTGIFEEVVAAGSRLTYPSCPASSPQHPPQSRRRTSPMCSVSTCCHYGAAE